MYWEIMGMKSSVQQLVLDTLQSACNAKHVQITQHTDLGDLGFDSLILTAIVTRAECAFGVRFSSDQIMSMFQTLLVMDLTEAIEVAIDHCQAQVHRN
jgi:acyl carrier protein